MRPITNPAVANVFAAYPSAAREALLALRALIFRTAATMKEVGEIEETLKWGEPAYLTSKSGSGSTIRLGLKASKPASYGIYFNCKTSLVDTFKTLFPKDFSYEGNRAIVFDLSAPIAMDAVAVCVAAALSYHQRSKRHAATVQHRSNKSVRRVPRHK